MRLALCQAPFLAPFCIYLFNPPPPYGMGIPDKKPNCGYESCPRCRGDLTSETMLVPTEQDFHFHMIEWATNIKLEVFITVTKNRFADGTRIQSSPALKVDGAESLLPLPHLPNGNCLQTLPGGAPHKFMYCLQPQLGVRREHLISGV